MKVLRDPTELDPAGRPVAVAIGVFDGVHRGHRHVLDHLRATARSDSALAVAVTFDRHPNSVVAPERTPPLIQTLHQRMTSLSEAGLDATWLIHFNEAFSRQPGEAFVRALVAGFGRVVSVHVGGEFHFGYRRSGNTALLENLGSQLGFATRCLPALVQGGSAISSTRIRHAIQAGELTAAAAMLGRAYTLAGTVVAGDRLGRQLGFPTANLDVAGLALPPRGVYAARIRAGDGSRCAVMNIGSRPTVTGGAGPWRVEVHLLDFQGDLYGQELEVEPVAHLRGERTFGSLDALRAQIASDIASARDCLRSPTSSPLSPA